MIQSKKFNTQFNKFYNFGYYNYNQNLFYFN